MDKQIIKNTKLKGTVLFTVVSVMMVLIVFVMATLTIASAASKRSYNTYFKNQSLYSARSVVDTTVQELLDGDATNTLKKEATTLSPSKKTLELSCELPTGMGTVTDLKVEYAGVDEIGTSTFVTGSGDGIIKITATVEMSGQASTYSQYVLKSAVVTTPAISEGALVSMGKGMQSDATSPRVYGSTYSFNSRIDPTDLDYNEKVKSEWSQLRNDGSVNALSYNSSVYINTGLSASFDKGNGMYIGGHLSMQNIPNFFSKAEKGTDGLMYSEIPHIYVGGVIYKQNPGNMTVGTKDNPINIYCGSIDGSGGVVNFTTYGDVYAYDEYNGLLEMVQTNIVQTGLTVFGSSGGGSSLLNWVDGLVNSTDGNFANHTGGSFYSNGRLQIAGNGSTFDGDVIVKDKVTINPTGGDVTIGGSLYAGNGLEIATDKNITISGGLFCDPTKLTVTGNVKVNGVSYGGNPTTFITAVNAAATESKVTATQAKISASPPTIFPKTMDKNYLFKGDETIADLDERAKTITLTDSKTKLDSFKVTLNKGTPAEMTEYKDYKANPEDAKICYNKLYTVGTANFTEASPLTENCTLYGEWNEDIYIKAEAGKTIWVCLENFKLEGKRIIVDNTSNPKNPGTVYLFVPEKGMVNYTTGATSLVDTPDGTGNSNGNLTLSGTGANGAGIVTSYYANLTESIDLTLYPLAKDAMNRRQVPNIYIYMAGGKVASETPGAVAPKLISTNQSIITGFICAPYITLDFSNPKGVGGAISYDGVPIANAKVAVIGQVIVGDINSFTNDNIVLQVSPNVSGGSGSEEGSTTGGVWTPIENAYGFGG